MSIRRVADWPGRLLAHIRERRDTPFQWGSNDCALFACDGVAAMTGLDLAAPLRGYKNALGSQRALRRHGFADLRAAAQALTRAAGAQAVNPRFAQRGDLVLVETERGQCLGLVDTSGARIAIADSEGLAFVPRALVTDAWRI